MNPRIKEVAWTLDFLDLGDMLESEPEPPAQVIDGLLYENGIHSIYSPGGTGKTIAALWMALQLVQEGRTVIYVDEENGAYHVSDLLRCMGADPTLIRMFFRYASAPGLNKESVAVWHRTVEELRPDLVVFDSLADHLALDNLSENNSIDVTSWMKDFAQPVKDAGGAVLILDHVAKDTSGKGARGSTAKLAKVDVAWKLTLDDAFDRRTIGGVTLTRDKDRMGAMPFSQSFTVGGNGDGELIFEPDGMAVKPKPKELTGNPKKCYDVLVSMFPDGAGAKEWRLATGLAESSFFAAVDKLKPDYLFQEGNLYHSTPLQDDSNWSEWELPI